MDMKNALFDAYDTEDYDLIESLYLIENADINYMEDIFDKAVVDKNENMIKFLIDLTSNETILVKALIYYTDTKNLGMLKHIKNIARERGYENLIIEIENIEDILGKMEVDNIQGNIQANNIQGNNIQGNNIQGNNIQGKRTESKNIVKMDIEQNIINNTQNFNNLLNAIQEGNLSEVKHLVSQGIDITSFNNLALQTAKDYNKTEIYSYLISIGAKSEKQINELLDELIDREDISKIIIAEDVSGLNINIFSDSDMVKDMIHFFEKGKELGKGAVGEVVLFEDTESVNENGDYNKYIVKLIKVCPKKMTVMTQTTCYQAKTGSIVFFVPDTLSGKYKLSIPPYFFEIIIGNYINNLFQATRNFMMTYGGVYDKDNYNTYIMMEYLDVNIAKRITNTPRIIPEHKEFKSIVYYILFQVCYALNFAQRYSRFVHHDLHWGNLMGRSKNLKPVCYRLDNDNYLYTLIDFDTVIIDYGFSRYETKRVVIHPQLEFFRGGKFPGGVVESYIFNPYYDIMSLFLHVFTGPIAEFFKSNDVIQLLRLYLKPLFYDFIGKSGESHIQALSKDHNWRGSSYLLYMDEYNLLNPSQMMKIMGKYLCSETDKNIYDTMLNDYEKKYTGKSNKNPINNPNMNDNTIKILYNKLIRDKFIRLDRFVNFNNETEKMGINFETENMLKEMDVRYYKSKIEDRDSFIENEKDVVINIGITNFDRNTPNILNLIGDPTHERAICKWDNQYITHAIIYKEAYSQFNYKFRFDCCDIDLRNYFQSNKIEKGVAINASFFKVNNDYTPIGYFNYNGYINDNPIPQFYIPLFRSIVIGKDGLDIVSIETAKKNKYEAITVGPILIENNVKIFNKEILDVYVSNYDNNNGPLGKIGIFQCSNREIKLKPENRSGVKFYPESNLEYKSCNKEDDSKFDYIPNCDRINPGELSHASNLNPRSALVICNNGTIIFVYVEGRNARGSGMDMVQLTNYCSYIGSLNDGAKHAINLDGGMSSNIVWRKDEFIKSTNPKHQFTYPLGTVLSCVKMRK